MHFCLYIIKELIKSDYGWLEMIYTIILNVRYTSVYDITYFIEENTDYYISIHSELTSPLTRLSAEMSTSVTASKRPHVMYVPVELV